MYPENFRYTKEHEWVLVEGDTATIGITDHAQQELGDIVYVDLPKPGAKRNARRITGYMRFDLSGRRLRHECVEPEGFIRFDVTPWQRANGTTSKLPPMPLDMLGG